MNKLILIYWEYFSVKTMVEDDTAQGRKRIRDTIDTIEANTIEAKGDPGAGLTSLHLASEVGIEDFMECRKGKKNGL